MTTDFAENKVKEKWMKNERCFLFWRLTSLSAEHETDSVDLHLPRPRIRFAPRRIPFEVGGFNHLPFVRAMAGRFSASAAVSSRRRRTSFKSSGISSEVLRISFICSMFFFSIALRRDASSLAPGYITLLPLQEKRSAINQHRYIENIYQIVRYLSTD